MIDVEAIQLPVADSGPKFCRFDSWCRMEPLQVAHNARDGRVELYGTLWFDDRTARTLKIVTVAGIAQLVVHSTGQFWKNSGYP